MKVAYGPPGTSGVKSLQYVSGDVDGIGDADYISSGLYGIAKPVAALGLGAAAYGVVTKNKALKRKAIAVSVAALVIQFLSKPR